MAYTYLGQVTAGSTTGNNVTTAAVDTTSANLIVIGVSGNAAASMTLSDSQSNTWSALTAQTSLVPNIQLFYCYAPTTNASHTFTVSSTTQYPSLFVSYYSGAASSPFDVQNGSAGGASSIQPGSVTPSENDELVVASMSYNLTTTISVDSSFTMTGQEPLVGGQHYGGGMAYIIQTTAGATNPTFSWTGSGSSSAVIATFKAAAAGAATGWGRLLGGARNRAVYQ